MKPILSEKALDFKRNISPVKEIMSFANPATFQKYGYKPTDIISFAGGWVNHESPNELKEAYAEIIEDAKLFHKSGAYPPTIGTPECREALVKLAEHVYDTQNLGVENIAIGINSTQITYNLFTVLLNPGDKVLLLDPSYCNFPSQVTTALDAKIIRFPVLNKESWEYVADQKAEEFHQFILENKPKLILLIAPDNPTSQVLSDEFVKAGLAAAQEIGSFLAVDFAYKELVFSGEYPDYFSWGPNDNFIALRSNSKWCRGLGRRLGWIEAPAEVAQAMEGMQGSSMLCPDMLHGMALTKYIHAAIANNSIKPYLKKTQAAYRKAADVTMAAIEKHLGSQYLKPQGGLYTVVKVNMDGAKFVEECIKQQGVLLVPGWGFGRSMIEGIRICYGPLVYNLDTIETGIQKISKCLQK